MELCRWRLYYVVLLSLWMVAMFCIVPVNSRVFEDMKKHHEEGPGAVLEISTKNVTPSPAQPKPVEKTCFHEVRENCPKTTVRCAKSNTDSVFCCDVNSFTLREGLSAVGQNVTKLHILNATIEDFDLSNPAYRRLKSMAVTDGNIGKISGQFPKLSTIACLNVSNNNLTTQKLTGSPLRYLFNLTVLDVSANNLTDFPIHRNISIDLSGNKHIQCKQFQEAMLKDNITFLNYNKTYCTINFKADWFSDFTPIPIDRMRGLNELIELCKKIEPKGINCTCENQRWEQPHLGAEITGITAVDCSNRNLTELPWNLPPNTIVLNVSYNDISSLKRLAEDSSYEQLKELDIDYNSISNIRELEGTKFLDNFELFRLRGNKLKYLHNYLFSNAFDKAWISRQLFVGNNYLHCDCVTEKITKGWLMEKSKNIPDYGELMCDSNLGRVIDLYESKVCQESRDWTHYIAYIITAEVLAIIVLVLKVSYDYWVFKSSGYLPWPANKMPRLPCDWLCE